MNSQILSNIITMSFELNTEERNMLSKRVSILRAEIELNKLSETLFYLKIFKCYGWENQITIETEYCYNYMTDIKKEIEKFLEDFLYYIALFGYQPELYQGDPIRIKFDNRKIEIFDDQYIYGEYQGYKFMIKKGE